MNSLITKTTEYNGKETIISELIIGKVSWDNGKEYIKTSSRISTNPIKGEVDSDTIIVRKYRMDNQNNNLIEVGIPTKYDILDDSYQKLDSQLKRAGL